MKKNIGLPDRLIRFVIAAILLVFALWQKSWIAGFASLFVFYEALAGWCIYYQLIGKSSCPLDQTADKDTSPNKITKLLICLFLCWTVEFTAAWFTQESVATWYPLLEKPWWTPPNFAFPVAWTILYTMMGVSLWLVWIKPEGGKTSAYVAFGIQLLLNFVWSFLFFYLRDPFYAFVDIILLMAAIAATIGFFWKHSPLAGMLLFPYIIWVAFASTLNLYILLLN